MDKSSTTYHYDPSSHSRRQQTLQKKNNGKSDSMNLGKTNQPSAYNDDDSHSCFCFESDKDSADCIRLKTRKGKILQRCVSNATTCAILVVYTFVGAIMFLAIETESGFYMFSTVNRINEIPLPGSKHSAFLNSNTTANMWLSEESRQRTVENIWDITISLNILYRENWTRLVNQEIMSFQEHLVQRLADELRSQSVVRRELHTQNRSTPEERHREIEWSLAKAFLYSLTVITTIGYGNIAPRTTLGKAVTMGYAAIGIPLMLIYLSGVGSLLSDCARGVFTRSLCCCLCSNCGYCCYDEKIMQEKERIMRKKREQKELEKQLQNLNHQEPFYVRSTFSASNGNYLYCPVRVESDCSKTSQASLESGRFNSDTPHGNCLAPLSFCFVTMIVYICGGAFILCRLESSWTYLDGILFCFMTLSTIGFAESIPASSVLSTKVNQSHTEGSLIFWFCSVYILTGMSLAAMCFNVVHDEIVQRLNHRCDESSDNRGINKENSVSTKLGSMSKPVDSDTTVNNAAEYTSAS